MREAGIHIFALYKNNLLMGFTSSFPPIKAKEIFLDRWKNSVKSCVIYEDLNLDQNSEIFPESLLS